MKTWVDVDALYKMVRSRTDYLQGIIKKKEKALKAAPSGLLSVSGGDRRTQYYYRAETGGSREYLGGDRIWLAKALAQRDYDKDVIALAGKELKLMKRLLRLWNVGTADELYDRLSVKRQALVQPLVEDAETYAEEWLSRSYEPGSFAEGRGEHFTENGEQVRSKSEVLIANALLLHHVPYRYEFPLYLDGYGSVRPDFQVLNLRTRKELFWEHFGMMDDPEYAESAVQKIRVYEKNGYYLGDKLIITMETISNPLNMKSIRGMIEHYLV